MALDFGKLNFSTSFNPTSAFPLDVRSYFESYDAAKKAAEEAVAAGSSESVYYYGQTLVVVENGKANLYIIQPNNTLQLIVNSNDSSSITINPSLFEYDDNNNLSLIGFNEAENGAFFTKTENGTIQWNKPIDAYTKVETDTQIAKAVSSANRMKRKIMNSTQQMDEYIKNNDDAESYIFMVPTGLEESGNKYDEYIAIFIVDEEDNITTKYSEKIGSWEVDLTEYAKIDYINTQLATKVTHAPGQRLMLDSEGTKLESIQNGAQVNLINSIATDFFSIDTTKNHQLNLKDIPIDKITGLQTALDSKLESASLESWIENHSSTVKGLSEHNLNTALYTKLNSNLLITTIDTNELSLSQNNQLSIKQISNDKVVCLQDKLNAKVETSTFTNTITEMNTQINNLASQMNNYVLANDYETEISKLWYALSWQDLDNKN